MKRISDCCDVSPPTKQHILTSDMSNRVSLNESLIMDHDQICADYDFVTNALLAQKRSSKNENLETSHIITSTINTTISLSRFLENYGNFPLPLWMSAAITRDVAKALLQLHVCQVTHGAVTAENIYFMKEKSIFCLLTSRANARKMNPERIMELRAGDISQLGNVLFRCLTGHFVRDEVNLTDTPFMIPRNGVILASKMMARKFSESIHYVLNNPFVVENIKKRTARFMKLTTLQ